MYMDIKDCILFITALLFVLPTIYTQVNSEILQNNNDKTSVTIEQDDKNASQNNKTEDQSTSLHNKDTITNGNTDIQSDSIRAVRLIDLAYVYIESGKLDSCGIILNKLDYFRDSKIDYMLRYRIHWLSAFFYSLQYNFYEQLNHLQAARKLLKTNDKVRIADTNTAIASVYHNLRDYESSLSIYQDNHSIYGRDGNQRDLLYNYYGIIMNHIELGNDSVAKSICFEALDIGEKMEETPSIGFVYSRLGEIYINESKLDSAHIFIEKGITISKSQNELTELYNCYENKVKLELARGNIKEVQRAAEIAVTNTLYHDPFTYSTLADIYSSQKQFEKSNELLRKNVQHYEEIDENNTIYTATSSLIKNKFDQQKEIELAIRDQKYQQYKFRIIFIISIATLLGLFSLVIIQSINKSKIEKINNDLIDKKTDLENFAYICSHDLMEPIRNIGSFSTLLQHKLKKEELNNSYNEYFDVIDNGTQVLVKVVESLKTYTNLHQDEILTKTKHSLSTLINKIISEYDQIIGPDTTITFVNDIQKDEIYSSEYGLRLLLRNFIDNAIKHNVSEQKDIIVTASHRGKDFLIKIEDNGIGIPSKYKDEIFLPFKSLKNRSQSNGSGLGLTICDKIMNLLGGEIWLESEVDQGSKFSILLAQ